MSKRLLISNSIVVLATNFFALDDSRRFKISDDPLHGALGYTHLPRHLSKHKKWISRQQNQHVRMIRQKRPMSANRSPGGHDGREAFCSQ